MWMTHLHAFTGYSPFCSGQVDFPPFGLAKLTRPHECERRQSKRALRYKRSLIPANRANECANTLRLPDRSVVALENGSERAAEYH
jgi:hypothetical protein